MNFFCVRLNRYPIAIILAISAGTLAQAEAAGRTNAAVASADASQHVEQAEPQTQALPDEGPRPEGTLEAVDGLIWQEGEAAYRKGEWADASRSFQVIIKQHLGSPLVPSALAFLTEIALHEDRSHRSHVPAIERYKELLRDYPKSKNAARAEWRIGDLYLAHQQLQEAQVAYEHAIAQSHHAAVDRDRARLGLGYTLMAMHKWTDAERVFLALRQESGPETVFRHSTIGLAHALYRQGRLTHAHALYEFSYRRWPTWVRLDPVTLWRLASTQTQLHHDRTGRELMLTFYNVYPRHDLAPTALLHVADSLVDASRPLLAEFVYSVTSLLHKGTLQDTMARMRAVAVRAEVPLPEGQHWGGLVVRSIRVNTGLVLEEEDAAVRANLQEIAARHPHDPAGSEALFHLGRSYEKVSDWKQALDAYKKAADYAGRGDDNPWPLKATERLALVLKPWIEAAVQARDDLTVATLFHRHGPIADQLYADSPLLLEVAHAHRRLGFTPEAVRLYQQLTKQTRRAVLEATLVGLGETYLDQQDPLAARKVLERYRFQFPTGELQPQALRLLVTAMQRQPDLPSLVHLSRQWLQHHPTHPDRTWMYLQLAAALGALKNDDESVRGYEAAFTAGTFESPDSFVAYADTLSRLNRHAEAIAAYQVVLARHPSATQAEWAHLQMAKHWNSVKRYDNAALALAELGASEDPLISRYASSFRGHLQAARRPVKGEGL